ncbi:hypothetical protein [Streptomyces sp. NPDC059828]|uniref:hypothetical protein n=1 Tax=Streptomyces sp. NPDC059828 TaxID=3346965 RepID=UPI00365BAD74
MRMPLFTAALGAAAAVLLMGAHPAPAADRPGEAAVRTAIRHAVEGRADATDLRIVANDPQLARSVPVAVKWGRPVVTEVAPPTGRSAEKSAKAARAARTGSSFAAGATASLASYQQLCRAVDYPLTLTSYLGGTIYTWHHKFSWCTANQISFVEASRVLTYAPYDRYDYFTDKSSVVYPQGLLTDATFAPSGSPITSWSGFGSPYYSHMARSVNLCFAQWSCYASNLPQSKLTIGRDNVHPAIAAAG